MICTDHSIILQYVIVLKKIFFLFPEAFLPKLSISPCCLERGTTALSQWSPSRPQTLTCLPVTQLVEVPLYLPSSPPCRAAFVCCSHPRIIFVHLPAGPNETFQKCLLCNLSQFSKSINFLCVARLSRSLIFKNRGCSTIMITTTGGIRESTHSSLRPSSTQTWRG